MSSWMDDVREIGNAVRHISPKMSHGEASRGFEHSKDEVVMADILLHQIVPSILYWYIKLGLC